MPGEPVRRTRGERRGGRSERVVANVLRTTLDELSVVGYGALRVEDVATRAGVNKTTIYRRWPTKAELVSAAIRALSGLADPLPDTGNVRGDLCQLVLRQLAGARTPEGLAIARLVTTERDPDVDRLGRALQEESFARRIRVVERAKARGDFPPDVDARLVLDAIFAPLMMRAYRFGENVEAKTVTDLVDLVMTGVQHGGGRARAPLEE